MVLCSGAGIPSRRYDANPLSYLTPLAALTTLHDTTRQDFQEHQYEIHEKLVAIMKDRLLVHCKSLLVRQVS